MAANVNRALALLLEAEEGHEEYEAAAVTADARPCESVRVLPANRNKCGRLSEALFQGTCTGSQSKSSSRSRLQVHVQAQSGVDPLGQADGDPKVRTARRTHRHHPGTGKQDPPHKLDDRFKALCDKLRAIVRADGDLEEISFLIVRAASNGLAGGDWAHLVGLLFLQGEISAHSLGVGSKRECAQQLRSRRAHCRCIESRVRSTRGADVRDQPSADSGECQRSRRRYVNEVFVSRHDTTPRNQSQQ
jgi:hypothetical protein